MIARLYSERPPRFVYELSASGRELAGALRMIAGWGARHAGGGASPRARAVRDADGGALVVPDLRAPGGGRRGRRAPLRLTRSALAEILTSREAISGKNWRVLRLMGIAISIGFADSLNPSTIAPALYLAAGERPRERVLEFTLAVFAVYLIGGLAIALGPGELLRSLVPHPRHAVAHIIETAVGAALIASSLLLYRHRRSLAKRDVPQFDPEGKSSWVLGATITAVELPTAFPYFAAIAAIVGSGVGLVDQLLLILLFNVCFVLPLVGIVGTLFLAPGRAQQLLGTGRDFLQRHWPLLLSGLALVAGAFVVLLGATGFASGIHGRFGHFARRFRRIIHP